MFFSGLFLCSVGFSADWMRGTTWFFFFFFGCVGEERQLPLGIPAMFYSCSDSFRRSQKTCMSIMLQGQWNKPRIWECWPHSIILCPSLSHWTKENQDKEVLQESNSILYFCGLAANMSFWLLLSWKCPIQYLCFSRRTLKRFFSYFVLQKLLRSQEALTTSSRMSPSETKDVQRHKGISSRLARSLLSS